MREGLACDFKKSKIGRVGGTSQLLRNESFPGFRSWNHSFPWQPVKRNHPVHHGGDPFSGLLLVLLAEPQALLLSRHFGAAEGKYRAFSFIVLMLLTQSSVLALFKHTQVFFISVLRAEPRTDIAYVRWESLCVLDMKISCCDYNWEERNTWGWVGTPSPPKFRSVVTPALTACILLSCFVLFHQLIYMMATTYNYAVLKFKSREDCCTKF